MADRRLDDALSSVLGELERSSPPPPAASAPPPMRGDDAALLTEIVGLLAELEQDRARRLARGADPQGLAALRLLADVVNALVGFVTARTRESSVLPSRVLARLAEADPYTQLLGEENERITIVTAEALLTAWTGNAGDRRRMAEDLDRALLDVLSAYGDAIAGSFRQAALREEWRETFAIFADDLRAAAQQMTA